MTETIKPAKVLSAVEYLVSTELYRKYRIELDDSWIKSFDNSSEVPFVANQTDAVIINEIFENQANIESGTTVFGAENSFHYDFLNPRGEQTLLENAPIENLELQRLVIAPVEGQRPLDLILDDGSEELSFASIYCGQKRQCTDTLTKIARSELRRYDR